jgi:hypothetical protein
MNDKQKTLLVWLVMGVCMHGWGQHTSALAHPAAGKLVIFLASTFFLFLPALICMRDLDI